MTKPHIISLISQDICQPGGALLAAQGQRVAVIDTAIQSPGIHILFGLAGDEITTALNDFLWQGRDIKDVARDVTPNLGVPIAGKIFFVPASTRPGEITRVLREGYAVKARV